MEIVTAQAPGREVTALYEAHALSLIRLAYVMLGDRPAAEDVVQEAFLGLYQRWSKLRDSASAPGYLRASVLNGCRMVLRSSARRDERIARIASELPWESAETTALVSEEYRHLLRGIRTPPRRSSSSPGVVWPPVPCSPSPEHPGPALPVRLPVERRPARIPVSHRITWRSRTRR